MVKGIVRKNRRELYIILLTIGLWVFIVTINENFGRVDYLVSMFGYNVVYYVCALGVLPLMIMRGIDLSVGSVMLVTSVCVSFILSYIQLPLFLVFLISISIGSCMGLVTGQIISRLEVSSVIVTLAMYSIYRGLSRHWLRHNPSLRVDSTFFERSADHFWGMPLQNWMIILMVCITYYLLKYHSVGRSVYMIGENQSLARRLNFDKDRTTLFVYAYSGFASGVAAFSHMTLLGQTNIEAYTGIEFDLIIIVIIGGLNILGGYGTVLGTFFATTFVMVLKSGLVFARIPAFWHDMLIGTIIIAIICYDMIKGRIQKQKMIGQGVIVND